MTETPVDVDVVDMDNDDEPEPWRVRRPRLMGKLSWVLLALLVAAGGFAAGAALKKPTPASSNAAAARAARAFTAANGTAGGGAGGGTGARQFGRAAASNPAASDATVGQVKLIDGTNVYVQTGAGDVIKIATTATTPIEITTSGTLSDLHVGDTLSVDGSAGADGTVAATSISRTATASGSTAAGAPSTTTAGGQP